jgi:hypothetical protein
MGKSILLEEKEIQWILGCLIDEEPMRKFMNSVDAHIHDKLLSRFTSLLQGTLNEKA